MWPVLAVAVVFAVYLCLGLFFLSIPIAVLTVPVGVLVGVGVGVSHTVQVLLGDDEDILYSPHDHIRAVGGDRPTPVDDAWVVYFAAQAHHDGLEITRRSLRLYTTLTWVTVRALGQREFGLGIVLLALPVTLPVAVGWLAVPLGIVAVLALAWTVGALLTGLAWLAGCTTVLAHNAWDTVWRQRYHRAAAACPRCHHVTGLPAYRCPGPHGELDDSLHFDLRPGLQGIRWRRCGCGERLPTGARRARRARLNPHCPLCRHRLHPDAALATDLRVAVLGAPSAGKTSLLAATICTLADRYAEEGGRFAPANRASMTRIDTLTTDFRAGKPTRASDPSPRPTGLLLHVVHGRHRTLMQFFDPGPGLDDDLAYLEYARTLLLVVDPFALETVREQARSLKPDLLGYARAGTYRPEQSYQDVAIPLRNAHVAHRQRLAVVVTKTDLLEELPVGQHLGHTSDEIRNWLVAQREDNLVLAAVRDFARVRFFRCAGVSGGESPIEAIRWLLSAEPFRLPS